MIVAIDGPAGSGKSTIARRLAAEAGLTYLDTGAMYRSLALLATRRGLGLLDEGPLVELASSCPVWFGRVPDGSQTVFIAGEDVTSAIRTPEVDAAVSAVSSLAGVREVMVARQRELAGSDDVVAEGRDVGTVVFPDADVKVFLTATPEARARRRAAQNVERGISRGTQEEYEAILASIIARDEADSTREVAPLACAEDAVRIDSSDMGADEVLAAVLQLVDRARSGASDGGE